MNEQQNTLLGFLQRQSLFDHPSNNLKTRSRSHRSKDLLVSRDKSYLTQQSRFTNSQQSSPSYNKYDNRNNQNNNQNSRRERNWDSPQVYMHNSLEKIRSKPPPQSYELQPERLTFSALPKQSQNSRQPERIAVKSELPINMGDGFQIARIQSFQCLEAISSRLWVQIIDINQKLENFHKTVRTWITSQLLNAQKSIINIVQSAFKEQEALIDAYVSKQEAEYAAQLAKTKGMLQSEYKRIDQLETHLRGPDWRKAAGQILSSNLEGKMEQFVKQTAKAGIPEWNPKSFIRDHLRIIEIQIKEIFKLKTFP